VVRQPPEAPGGEDDQRGSREHPVGCVQDDVSVPGPDGEADQQEQSEQHEQSFPHELHCMRGANACNRYGVDMGSAGK